MRALMLIVPVLLLAACGGGQAQSGGTVGTLVIGSEYREPPPGEPLSIGGYGFFATVPGSYEAVEVPFDGELSLELPPGTHELVVETRPRSDVATVVDGEERFEYYEPTATCTLEVEVPEGGEIAVRHVATGGNTCELEAVIR